MKSSVFIHPNAIVESESIGENTRIWAFVHILGNAKIGVNCNICDHCFIEDDVVIGDNVTVKSGIYIWNGARIEDDVFLGPNVTFTNDIYPRSKVYPQKYPQTLIRQGASVGAHSVLLAGTIIGRHAIVGAGSVIAKNVGDFELVYGNPARHRGYICKCKAKLRFGKRDVLKSSCGSVYSLKDG
ncbi:MAG TPA: acyltransferase, partial [Bacteroidota bacterium]|nr:acyltransferase [Bacteroidota bacterium]